jgi:Ser/Thr protein kinase RdoA (MazF antagonist)
MLDNSIPSDWESIGPSQAIARYPVDCHPTRIHRLGSAGGFSGARFWRLETPRGMLCLRRWPGEFPAYPAPEQLAFIHSVLEHVHRRGFMKIPVPIRALNGQSFVSLAAHLWESTPWLPGSANYLPERNPRKLTAAMQALARWHRAAVDFPWNDQSAMPSPGIEARLLQIDWLRSGGFDRLVNAVHPAQVRDPNSAELVRLARQLFVLYPRVEASIRPKLLAAREICVPLQPCIRDVWHDHVLFEGEEVSGLIDFGALKVESVAGDVARLLDSMAGDDLPAWQTGLAAYGTIRPLSDDELFLVSAFDESLALLSGMNWLDWIFLSGRVFDDLKQVISRLRTVVDRLEVFSRFRRIKFAQLA